MKNIYLKAKAYVLDKGTDFQKACCRWIDGAAEKSEVIEAFSIYQNEDGGFSNGLEVEYQGTASSALTTAAALAHIARFELKGSEMYQKVISYLKRIQGSDGSFDDDEAIDAFPHPPYMGKGIYVPYKTGVILKWLRHMECSEKEMLEAAMGYMEQGFEEVSKTKDIWMAIGYMGAFSDRTDEFAQKVMAWCMSILGGDEIGDRWAQYSNLIESGVDIEDEKVSEVLSLMQANQEEDGGWSQAYGEYYRVWLAVYLLQFMKQNGEI